MDSKCNIKCINNNIKNSKRINMITRSESDKTKVHISKKDRINYVKQNKKNIQNSRNKSLTKQNLNKNFLFRFNTKKTEENNIEFEIKIDRTDFTSNNLKYNDNEIYKTP